MDDDWSMAIGEYRIYLRSTRFAPGSVKVHSSYLRRLALQQPRGPWTVTTTDLRRFLAVERWKPNTARSARAAVVKFYRWALLEGYVSTDPAVRLDSVSVPPAVPRPAPWHVIIRAIELSADREATMLRFARYAALRCCEIAMARRDNWDGRGLWVTGKGGKVRYVPIVNAELVAAITGADGWLFPGRIDGHLSAGTVSRLMSEALAGAWTGHKLRHAFATASNSRHPDLLALRRVLGHARPETTQVYTQVPFDSLLEVVRAADPESDDVSSPLGRESGTSALARARLRGESRLGRGARSPGSSHARGHVEGQLRERPRAVDDEVTTRLSIFRHTRTRPRRARTENESLYATD